MPAIARQIVGKVRLAELLGWSRPKLERRLNRDPHFPVMDRGSSGKGRAWQFDFEDVQNYLSKNPEPETESDFGNSTTPTTSENETDGTPDHAQPSGFRDVREETARARRDAAHAAIMEDKLRLSRGELVPIEDVKQTISAMLMHLGKGLEALPDQIKLALNLSPAAALTIQGLVNNLRTSMVNDLQKDLKGS